VTTRNKQEATEAPLSH